MPPTRHPDAPLTVAVLGAGLIGLSVVHTLIERGHHVRVLLRRAPTEHVADSLHNAQLFFGDAAVPGALDELIDGCDHVISAMGALMPSEAEANPAADMSMTLSALLGVLDTVNTHEVGGFTLASSGGTVYGPGARLPTRETDPTNPVSAYGISRLAAERFVMRHSYLHGTPVRVARIANAYGPHQSVERGQGVVAAALDHCHKGTPMRIFGDGEIRRDFIHVEDIAFCLARLVERNLGPEIVNIGSGSSTSVNELCDIVRRVTDRPLLVERLPARHFDVASVQLDISTLRSITDFTPRSLETGVAQTWWSDPRYHADTRHEDGASM
jgi:UDP-glucose 4-epimerase